MKRGKRGEPEPAHRGRKIDHSLPRVVLITRKPQAQLIEEAYGTPGQARFALAQLGASFEKLEAVEDRQEAGLAQVQRAIPADQRRARVERSQLPRFLFDDDDVIVVVGQDGLVPNVAKYLAGQPTIGINPDPGRVDGILCRHRPQAAADLLAWSRNPDDRYSIEERALVRVDLDDGRSLRALNEIFVGHRTHQSARYQVCYRDEREQQSSSGLICTTGTGATGWARSIAEQRGAEDWLPGATSRRLAFFVREPFPSVWTGTSIGGGPLEEGEELLVTSDLEEGGVIFADGIEDDYLEFRAGQTARIKVSGERLRLVVPATRA